MRSFSLAFAIFFILPHVAFSEEPLSVSRVVEGDILELSNGEKVSLIGVDTPESSNNFKLWRDARNTGQDTKEILAKGQEAAEFTWKLVEGRPIRFEYDVERKDKYGRTLAYAFIQMGGPQGNYEAPAEYEITKMEGVIYIFLNATLAKAGYAQVVTLSSNVKYLELFVKLEKEALEQKRGLWREAKEEDRKKLGYKLGLEDVTGRGDVRASNAKIGVDYKVSENSTVGVEASQGIHDSQDAAAWGKSVDDATAAQAKYKISF
ncbi:MAG: thermonuclease family protein [Candidatus Omnitrophota bacterium]